MEHDLKKRALKHKDVFKLNRSFIEDEEQAQQGNAQMARVAAAHAALSVARVREQLENPSEGGYPPAVKGVGRRSYLWMTYTSPRDEKEEKFSQDSGFAGGPPSQDGRDWTAPLLQVEGKEVAKSQAGVESVTKMRKSVTGGGEEPDEPDDGISAVGATFESQRPTPRQKRMWRDIPQRGTRSSTSAGGSDTWPTSPVIGKRDRSTLSISFEHNAKRRRS